MLSTVRHAWSRILTIARPFANYELRWQAVGTFALIIGLLLAVNGLNVLNSYFGRDMMNALEKGNAHAFGLWLFGFAAMFFLITVVQVSARFFEERLVLLLRDGLTRYLIGRYLADQTHNRLIERQD